MMIRVLRSRVIGLTAALFLMLSGLLVLSCSGPLLRPLLEGSDGSAWAGALSVHPAAVSVIAGTPVTFTATGGAGGYVFSVVSGTGTIDPGSGTYHASFTPGIEHVRVQDSRGSSAEAQVTITATGASNPDYRISALPAVVFPGPGAGGSSFSGSFSVENIAADPGTMSVLWSVYVSADAAIGAGDLVVDSGSIAPLAPGAVSSSVSFNGAWPAAGGNYYLIIAVSASDEVSVANNTFASASTAVSGVPAPDYQMVSVATPPSAVGGSALSVPITYTNSSTSAGTTPVTWEVYYSPNTTIDVGDQLIGSGSAPALGAGASASPTVSATWPMSAGVAYLIARVSAVDDGNTTDNVVASAGINLSLPDVNYLPSAITAPVSAVVGNSINESFMLQNAGTQTGTSAVNWAVYASPGNQTVGDPGDILIASGSHAAVAGLSSQPVAYSGTWSVPAGSYYLVVQVSAADDLVTANNVTGSALAVPVTAAVAGTPDYVVTSVPVPAGTTAGMSVSGTFTVQNNGTAAGASPVNWYAYASLGDAVYNSGDILIASGTIGALGTGLNNSPPYNGVWPGTAGSYFVVVVVQAADDPVSGTAASAAIAVGPPNVNYHVSSMNITPGTLMPDQGISGDFQYQNSGTSNGQAAQTVSWEVYASLNATIDGSDTLIASGTGLSALNAGNTSGNIAWNGVWPLDFGVYSILIRVSAAEDTNATDNVAASAATYSVGYFAESEPNDDWNTLAPAQIDIPGVTLKPGMSIHISGSMNPSDVDDVFQFDTGSATVVVASISYGGPAKSISLYIFNGPAASFGNGVGITATDLALQWTVDTAQCWVDFENTGGSNLGAYTLIVSAF